MKRIVGLTPESFRKFDIFPSESPVPTGVLRQGVLSVDNNLLKYQRGFSYSTTALIKLYTTTAILQFY